MQIWSQCFYEMLYKTRDVDNCEINELISEIVKLSEEQQVSLEWKITLEEAGTVLKNYIYKKKKGKVPEVMALVQIFKNKRRRSFWRQIGDFVLELWMKLSEMESCLQHRNRA